MRRLSCKVGRDARAPGWSGAVGFSSSNCSSGMPATSSRRRLARAYVTGPPMPSRKPSLRSCRAARRAGEAVDHAAQSADAADRGDHRHRRRGMHDHRQVEFAGKAKLPIEVEQLCVSASRPSDDCPARIRPTARAFAFDPRAQCRQVFRAVRVQHIDGKPVGGMCREWGRRGLAQLDPNPRRRPPGRFARHVPAATSAGMRGGARSASNSAASKWLRAVDQWARQRLSGLPSAGAMATLRFFQGQQQGAEAQQQLVRERNESPGPPRRSQNRIGHTRVNSRG